MEDEEIVEAEKGLSEDDSAVVQLVNKIILDAHERNASDIHIEPYPGSLDNREENGFYGGRHMAHRKKSVTLVWTEILECGITRSHERGRILDF